MEWISVVIIALILIIGKSVMDRSDRQAEAEDRIKEELQAVIDETPKEYRARSLKKLDIADMFSDLCRYQSKIVTMNHIGELHNADYEWTYYEEGVLIRAQQTYGGGGSYSKVWISVFKAPYPPFPPIPTEEDRNEWPGFDVWTKSKGWIERGPWEKRVIRLIDKLIMNYTIVMAREETKRSIRNEKEMARLQMQSKAHKIFVEEARSEWEGAK